MGASTWFRRVLYVAGVAVGLCLAGPSRADEKDKKDSGKGKEDKRVIVIQLDASKVPPGVLKQLLEMSGSTGKEGDKRSTKGDDDKKPAPGKDGGKKPNTVQVDLNKLPPDLAKRLAAELAKGKGDGQKSGKKDDDDKKGDKGKGKDDDKKQGGRKDDDDKKGGKKGDEDDDDKRGGKKKDD